MKEPVDRQELRRIRRHVLAAEHERLYFMNAWFKASIDTLADLLPFLVAGLAQEAETKDAEVQKQLTSLMKPKPS